MKIMIYSSKVPDPDTFIEEYPFLADFGYENEHIIINSLDDLWHLSDKFTNGLIIGRVFSDVIDGMPVDEPGIEITDKI